MNEKTKNYPYSNSYRLNVYGGLQTSILDPVANLEEFDIVLGLNGININMYIAASTRSGKSELIKLIYIRHAIRNDGSILLFDPHGDLALQCAKLMDNKKDIIYIDLTDKKGIATINPFRLKSNDVETVSIVTQELVCAFESIIKTDFSVNMEVLLTPLVSTLLLKGDSGIDELIRFLDDNNNEDLIALALQSPIKAHRDFIKDQFSKAKFKKTKDALATKLQLFLNNQIFSNFVLGESTIDLEYALNNKKIVIVRLPKSKMKKTLEPAAKLIMGLVQGIAFKRDDLEERPKTYVICDEYQNMMSDETVEMLSESAKYGLYILGAHQHLSQLDNKTKASFMSGANIKIVGKNSNKDLRALAEEIEVDVSLLKNLNPGEFYVKAGSNDAIKVITTDKFLGKRNAISDEQWKKHLKYQRKKYYKKIEKEDITDNTSISTNDVSSTKSISSLPIPKFDMDEE